VCVPWVTEYSGCGKNINFGGHFFFAVVTTNNRCQNNKLINEPRERVSRACRLWLQWDLCFGGRD